MSAQVYVNEDYRSNRRICRFAGGLLPPPRPSPTGEGVYRRVFGVFVAVADLGKVRQGVPYVDGFLLGKHVHFCINVGAGFSDGSVQSSGFCSAFGTHRIHAGEAEKA